MTFVELFDRAQTENAVNIAAHKPEKVIFVGEARFLQAREKFFRDFAKDREMETELVFQSVNPGSIENLIETLEKIVQQEDELCIDLTGGSDLALTAAGVIMERYKERNVCFRRYNIRTGALTICGGPEPAAASEKPELTVQENIVLHGGCMIDNFEGKTRPGDWDLTDGLREDICTIWDIAREDPSEWNRTLTDLLYAVSQLDKCTRAEAAALIDDLLRKPMGRKLYMTGILQLTVTPGLQFKSEEIAYILGKSGSILEVMTMLAAKDARIDGEPLFNDVRTSVFIDWDGVIHKEAVDVTNEIDVVMMKGLVPVFVSCKFGAVSPEELYKLNAVAERFGGKYVKKVLIACSTDVMKISNMEIFRDRAASMGILLLTDIQRKTYEEFRKMIEKQLR